MSEGVNDMSASTTELTPGQRRIAKAQAKRLRDADEKLAAKLRIRGWMCTPPEAVVAMEHAVRSALVP
jgi:hypothetical protein